MREVHPRARVLERVHRPVPAIGGLQHHLRFTAGTFHHRPEPVSVVEDPDRLQHLARIRGPHHHTAATVQIDTDELLPCAL
jgi:hypothetical protein